MADTYLTLTAGREVAGGPGGLVTMQFDVGITTTDVATLVADGASPTQAHVTTLANDWATFLSRWAVFTGFPTGANAAIFVNIDVTAIPTVSVLRTMFNQILRNAASQGMAP